MIEFEEIYKILPIFDNKYLTLKTCIVDYDYKKSIITKCNKNLNQIINNIECIEDRKNDSEIILLGHITSQLRERVLSGFKTILSNYSKILNILDQISIIINQYILTLNADEQEIYYKYNIDDYMKETISNIISNKYSNDDACQYPWDEIFYDELIYDIRKTIDIPLDSNHTKEIYDLNGKILMIDLKINDMVIMLKKLLIAQFKDLCFWLIDVTYKTQLTYAISNTINISKYIVRHSKDYPFAYNILGANSISYKTSDKIVLKRLEEFIRLYKPLLREFLNITYDKTHNSYLIECI
jgi:hypothetical protein